MCVCFYMYYNFMENTAKHINNGDQLTFLT